MNQATFERGQRWDDYLASMQTNRILMTQKVAAFRLEEAHPFTGSPLRAVLAFTDDWCQDSVTAFPPLVAIVAAAQLELRVTRRSVELSLQQALTGLEYPPIPTFLFYDSEWRERGRFLEMPDAFRRALQDPAEAAWLRELYDETWWEAQVAQFAALFAAARTDGRGAGERG